MSGQDEKDDSGSSTSIPPSSSSLQPQSASSSLAPPRVSSASGRASPGLLFVVSDMKKKALEEYRLRQSGSVTPIVRKSESEGPGSTPIPSPRPSPVPIPVLAAAVTPPSPDVKLPEIPSRPSTTPRHPEVTVQTPTLPQIHKEKAETELVDDSRRPHHDPQDVGITIKGGVGGKQPQKQDKPHKEIINPYDEEDDAMQTSLAIGPGGKQFKGAPLSSRKRSMPQQRPRGNVGEADFSAEIGGVGRGPRKTSRDQLSGAPPNSDETSKTSMEGQGGTGRKKGAERLVILGDGQQEEFDRRLSGMEGSGSHLSGQGSGEFGSGELGISGAGSGSRDGEKGVSASQRRSELKSMKRGDREVSMEGFGLGGGIDEEGDDTSGDARKKRADQGRKGVEGEGDWGPDYKLYSHNKAQSGGDTTGGAETSTSRARGGGFGRSRTTGDTGTLDEYDYDENKRKIAGRNADRDISTVDTTNVQDSTPQQYYGNEQDYIDEEDDEEEEEMVVLDPEHPLMVRMQGALTKYLTKQLDKLELELKEKTQQQKSITAQREELGVNLYGIQQQLAKQQMLLEQEHDTHASARQQRVQVEELAKQIEQLYNATISDCKLHQEKDGNLRDKVEALDSTLFYLSQLETNLHNDINITKRAANKALEDITTAEDNKYNQDLYVDRLVEQVDRLTQEIAMYEAQDHAQSDETNSMQALLSEASMELEAVLLEKKKLLQQWQTSLIGMQRRDEAKAAMNQAVESQRETIQALETELNGYKKSITKEQQQNEQLTMLHNKLQMDMATIKRHIQTSLQKREAIKTEYTKYTKILQESELALSKATTDRNIKMNNVNALRQQIEKESRENRKVQEQIYEVHQKGLTMDKSAQYSEKNATKRRKQAQELEAEVANVENDISMKMLEISNAVTAIKGLDEELKNIDVEIREKNDLISHCESEGVKKNAIIERKQGQIDQFNKKIDQLTQKDGGEEVGPLEVQVVTLQKQIKDTEQEKQQLEQYWLRTQSHLVTLSSQAENQWGDVNKMKKQHTILQQKKMRIDTELATTSREIKDQEGNIRQLQNDMTKLNLLITKKTGEQQDKQQDTILMENDFLETLKEAEKNSIEMQNQVDSLTEEKERLLSSLVDSERQIMLWEKKIQLAKETRNTVDTEYGQGELKAMKCEIHRMQVRYNQLMKQQELLIQEMEKAVYRREAITVRGEAQGKLSKKVQTKGTLKKKVEELRKKVKGLAQEAANCDGEINKLQEHQSALAQTLEDKNNNCKELRQTADNLSSQQERLALEKDKAMQDLLSKQKKIKYLDMVKNKKYKMMCKSEDGIEKVRARETERLQSLVNIVDHMNREYPHLRPALHKSTLLLTWRAVPEHV